MNNLVPRAKGANHFLAGAADSNSAAKRDAFLQNEPPDGLIDAAHLDHKLWVTEDTWIPGRLGGRSKLGDDLFSSHRKSEAIGQRLDQICGGERKQRDFQEGEHAGGRDSRISAIASHP